MIRQIYNCACLNLQEGGYQRHKARIDSVAQTLIGETEEVLCNFLIFIYPCFISLGGGEWEEWEGSTEITHELSNGSSLIFACNF